LNPLNVENIVTMRPNKFDPSQFAISSQEPINGQIEERLIAGPGMPEAKLARAARKPVEFFLLKVSGVHTLEKRLNGYFPAFRIALAAVHLANTRPGRRFKLSTARLAEFGYTEAQRRRALGYLQLIPEWFTVETERGRVSTIEVTPEGMTAIQYRRTGRGSTS
jgi:hypothetical protein